MDRNRTIKLVVGADVNGAYTGTTINTIENGGVAGFTSQNSLLVNQTYAATESATTTPGIRIVQGATKGNVSSTYIRGNRVHNYTGSIWAPTKNQVTTVGYDGNTTIVTNLPASTGAGSIPVAANTEYTLTINFKEEKQFFSYFRRYVYVTGSTATQLSVGTAVVALINSDLAISATKPGKARAVLIGNGTGVDGLTGATNYGIKLVGLTPDVFFTVHLDLGWIGTRVVNHVRNTLGVGNMSVNTYEGLDEFERWTKGQSEGVMNRVWLPPTPDLYINQNGFADPTSFTTNGTATALVNVVSMTSVTGLAEGQRISINGRFYKIERIDVANNDIRVEDTFGAAVNSGDVVIGYGFYSLINIQHEGEQETQFNNEKAFAPMTTIIAIPRYRDTATSTYFVSNLLVALNNYMVSTPAGFAPITSI
jgi:hypothetical protein